MSNLYVHFPFCRRKCTYCALYSKCNFSAADRQAYVQSLADQLPRLLEESNTCASDLKTVYFGGGSPAICDLSPIFKSLHALGFGVCPQQFHGVCPQNIGVCPQNIGVCPQEFTVELHPQDVTEDCLIRLRDGGVNRISMGVQSLDDATLAKMGRGYRLKDAERAFQLVRRYFDNAGIDLILGYPGDPCANWQCLADWGLRHCSVYSLILEPESRLYRQLHSGDRPQKNGDRPQLPSDDQVLDQLAKLADYFNEIGLERYEISNYAVKGFECQHNLAVWRGEDYLGLGAGAYGRFGLQRTRHLGFPWGLSPEVWGLSPEVETVDFDADRKERTLFRLRTREGLDASGYPQWGQTLDEFCKQGLLTREGSVYKLTPRGTEVCDSILAELV